MRQGDTVMIGSGEAPPIERSVFAGRRVQLPALIGALGIGLGFFVAVDLRLAVATLCLAWSVGLLVNARLRLVTVLGGSLLALQSTEGFSLAKAAFAAMVIVAVAGAALGLAGEDGRAWRRRNGSLIGLSMLFGLLLVASLPIALSGGAPLQSWLRDVAPYLLFAAAPLLAIDAARAFSQRMLATTLLIVGGLGAASFMIQWLARRGLAALAVERLTFPSFLLATALFCYAIACIFVADRHRTVWLIAAAGSFSALIITATRSTLVLLFAILLAPLISGRGSRGLARAATYVPILTCVTIVAIYTLATLLPLDRGATVDRLSTVGNMVSSPTIDASGDERVAETRAAWRVFTEHPLGGTGPGHEFSWTQPGSMVVKRSFNIDTSVSYIAKFGLLGLALVIPLIVNIVAICIRRYPSGEVSASRVAAILYFVVVLVWSVLGPPLEDKGFVLALMIILAMRLKARSQMRRPGAAEPPQHTPATGQLTRDSAPLG